MININITNKKQSNKKIKEKYLNTVVTSESINLMDSKVSEFSKIRKFLAKNKYDKYGIMEMKPNGLFTYSISQSDIIDTIVANYHNKNFIICESMYNYDKHNLLIHGDFYITKDFIFTCGYSDIKGKSLIESCKKFKYSFENIDLKESNVFKGNKNINNIIDYIITNELFDTYVELTLYNCNVGIKKEPIIIWEIRNY